MSWDEPVVRQSEQIDRYQNILITRERHRLHLEQCLTHLENFEIVEKDIYKNDVFSSFNYVYSFNVFIKSDFNIFSKLIF